MRGVPPSATRRYSLDLAAIFVLVLLAFVLYHPVLGLFWHADDFYNLRFSRQHTPLQVLASPATWVELPFKMVTPLMFLSFQLDLALAGTSPYAFYLHQLLAVGLCAVLLYALLRLWIEPFPAFVGGGFLLFGAPAGGLAATLMVRHYPEAIALLSLAIATFVLAVRRGSRGRSWSLLSAALYAAACLAKEIAVPLAPALLLLPEGDLRKRLRTAIPHGAVLVLYFAYRRFLLGTWGGGYGWAVERGEWPALALSLPFKMAREMVGGGGALGWLLFALLLLSAGFGIVSSPRPVRSAAGWLAVGAFVLLPILPVLAAAAALGASAFPSRAWRNGLLLGLAMLGGLAWRGGWQATYGAAGRTSVENRAYLRLGSGDLLLRPLGYPASMGELRLWAREPAAWAYDELAVCPPRPGRRVWEYDPAVSRVVQRSAELPARCAVWRARVRPAAPLTAAFQARPYVLSWHLGPYREGSYALLIGDGAALFPLPREGAFQRPAERLAFRLRYESPAGWITYSPELIGDFPHRPVLRWRRPAFPPPPGRGPAHPGGAAAPPDRPAGRRGAGTAPPGP